MGIFDTVKEKFRESQDKKDLERAQFDALRKEQQQMEQIEFEKEFRRSSLELARKRAKRDALKKSGLEKMRALERSERMKQPRSQMSSKLAEFSALTARNRERTEKNRELAVKKRDLAKELNEERMQGRKQKVEDARRMRETRKSLSLSRQRDNKFSSQMRKPFSK